MERPSRTAGVTRVVASSTYEGTFIRNDEYPLFFVAETQTVCTKLANIP
jgi:hypothetical protein